MSKKCHTDGVPEYDDIRRLVCYSIAFGIRLQRGDVRRVSQTVPDLHDAAYRVLRRMGVESPTQADLDTVIPTVLDLMR